MFQMANIVFGDSYGRVASTLVRLYSQEGIDEEIGKILNDRFTHFYAFKDKSIKSRAGTRAFLANIICYILIGRAFACQSDWGNGTDNGCTYGYKSKLM